MSQGPWIVRILSFTEEHIAVYIAQVGYIFKGCEVTKLWQVFSMDEIGFTPGRYLVRKVTHRVVTKAGERATWSKDGFRYVNIITLLTCINGAGNYFCPCSVFRGVKESLFNYNGLASNVSQLLQKLWICYWWRDVGSIDAIISQKWVRDFLSTLRGNPEFNSSKGLLMFYDGARANMRSEVLQLCLDTKVVVMALPVHTSNRAQPLDISVFGPLKHFTNLYDSEFLLRDASNNSYKIACFLCNKQFMASRFHIGIKQSVMRS